MYTHTTNKHTHAHTQTGALGGRLDHTLAAINTLHMYPHLNIMLLGDGNVVGGRLVARLLFLSVDDIVLLCHLAWYGTGAAARHTTIAPCYHSFIFFTVAAGAKGQHLDPAPAIGGGPHVRAGAHVWASMRLHKRCVCMYVCVCVRVCVRASFSSIPASTAHWAQSSGVALRVP